MKSKQIHHESDKTFAPYLLAASFNGLLTFEGTSTNHGVVTLMFSPESQAQELLTKFQTKTDPRIPAKDIFDAISTFWSKIKEEQNRELDVISPNNLIE